MAGLQQLCTEGGEAAHKWAEHVNMIASVAQLHKDWAEASLLFRLANPVLKQLHAEEGLEYAELLNSEGECLLELKCHHLAAPLFDLAHTAVATAQGSDDASVASIEANQAAVLSASGQGQRAETLFAAALERIRTSAVALEEEEAAQQGQQQGQGGEARAEEQSNLFMVQVMQARVLKLYAAHEEATAPHAAHAEAQARQEHAKTLRAEALRLETTYGFCS
jgi:hypothetical protein